MPFNAKGSKATQSTAFRSVLALGLGLAVLGTGLPAKADVLSDVKGRGKMLCGTVPYLEPMSFRAKDTGEITGFDVDICKAVAARLGVGIEIVPISLEARLPELQIGRIDILSAVLGYTAERAKQIDYSDSHFQVPLRVFVTTESPLKSLNDITGKKIGSVTSSTPDYWLRRSYPKAISVTFRDSPSAYLALTQGKIAGQGNAQTSAARFIVEAQGKLRYLDGVLGWEPNGLGIKKGETAFLTAVNEALKKMESDGEIDRLWTKWLGPDTVFKIERTRKLTPIAEVAVDMAKPVDPAALTEAGQ